MTRPGLRFISDLTFRDRYVVGIVWETGLVRLGVRFTETEREGDHCSGEGGCLVGSQSRCLQKGRSWDFNCLCDSKSHTVHLTPSVLSSSEGAHTPDCHCLPFPYHFSQSGFSRTIFREDLPVSSPLLQGFGGSCSLWT